MSPKKSSPEEGPVERKTTSKKAPSTKKPASGGATKPDQMQPDVLEFIQAIDDYKRNESRPFPTWSEILDIVKTLGYERPAAR